MGAEQYEVVVTGAAEATPAAEARLGAMLARTHGLPVAGVVRALGQKNLRVGEGLSRESAEALVRQLQSMGALTTVRRSTVALAAVQPVPTPVHGFPAAGNPANSTLQGVGAVAGSAGAQSAPGRGGGLGPLAPGMWGAGAPLPAAAPASLRPLGSGRPDPASALPAPVSSQPDNRIPTGMHLDVASAISSFALPETPAAPGGNAFSVPEEAEQALELDVKPPKEGAAVSPHPSHSLPGASALNTSKLTATSSVSGLRLSSDDAREDTVRCPTHGLLYDSRKYAGCRRCLESKRSAARGAAPDRGTASGGRASTWAGRLSPARRAFLGLFLALGLSFLPAAYYTLGPINTGVARLRAEQTALSERPGTEDNLARFDQIDADVDRTRSRGVRNTLLLWVAGTGILMAGWYRLTS